MEYIILLLLSILPVVLVGWFIYNKDREKEPTKLLFKIFGSGALAVIATVIITLILQSIFPYIASSTSGDIIQTFVYAFVGVAIIEEFTKWFVVYKIAYNNEHFNETYDVVVYGAFSALGFACLENVAYVFAMSGIKTALFRAFTAIPGHTCYGIIMGYFLGKAKVASLNSRKDLEKKNIILSIIIPTLAHGFYDFCILSQNLFLVFVDLIYIIVLYIYIFTRIKKMSNGSRGLVSNNSMQVNNQSNVAFVQNMAATEHTNTVVTQDNVSNISNQILQPINQNSEHDSNPPVVSNHSNFCSNCGSKIDQGNFCPNCGNKIN